MAAPSTAASDASGDTLVHLNSKTGNNLSIAVRILHGRSQVHTNPRTSKTWSVFAAKLVDAHGNYCGFEAKAFGADDGQKKAMDGFQKKFADGLAFRMSRIKSVKSANPQWDFYSVMQIIDYEAKKDGASVVLTPIQVGSAEDKSLPLSIESKIRLKDLESLQDSRAVDICAVLKSCTPPTKTSDKAPIWELSLADESGVSVSLTWWSSTPKPTTFDMENSVGKAIHFFGVRAARRGDAEELRPLASTDKTLCVLVVADKACARGKKLVQMASDIASKDTVCITVAASYNSQDHSLGDAIESTLSNLSLLDNRGLTIPDPVFQIRSVSLDLSTRVVAKSDLYVKDGSRLFIPVVAQDATGSIECRMSEKAALILTGLDDSAAVEECYENGSLSFQRAVVRVLRTSSDVDSGQNYINFVVVAAIPVVAGPWRMPHMMVSKIGTNVVATTLDNLAYTPLGSFQINIGNGKSITADKVLLLLRGSKEPRTKVREGAVMIENINVIDAAGDDKTVTAISTTTVAPASALASYSLMKTSIKVCLATAAVPEVTGNAIRSLVISSVWSPDQLNVDATMAKALFAAEIKSSMEYCRGSKAHKRKADVSLDDASMLFTPSPKNLKYTLSAEADAARAGA
jgi:hypothetical protein